MKKVTLYKSYDNRLFEDWKECKEHELYMLSCQKEMADHAKEHYEDQKQAYGLMLEYIEKQDYEGEK